MANGNGKNENGGGNSTVAVTVNYQSTSKTKDFPRGSKVAPMLATKVTPSARILSISAPSISRGRRCASMP